MGSMTVSSCRCMFVSCVYSVAVINAVVCWGRDKLEQQFVTAVTVLPLVFMLCQLEPLIFVSF